MAATRIKMRMKENIGRECRTVHVLQTKKKECVKSILKNAMSSGVANITPVWREFHACKKDLVQVALASIRAVAKVKSVCVMDLHGLTYLFDFPTFKKILDLLASSSVFAINLGEDEGTLGSEQFLGGEDDFSTPCELVRVDLVVYSDTQLAVCNKF